MNNRHVTVAVGIIEDPYQRKVLLARRPVTAHQGGLWEFPGGKVEAGESVFAALQRELTEEIGISVQQARPLIRITHTYSEKQVLLDVWRVEKWTGQPIGREGQAICWYSRQVLENLSFPPANFPILKAIHLPDFYFITPEPSNNLSEFLEQLERVLSQGIRLVQLRAKQLSPNRYYHYAKSVATLCERYQARLLLNAEASWVTAVGAQGIHLTQDKLMNCVKRPLPAHLSVAASCHDTASMLHACQLGVDFIVLSPVKLTASHPHAKPLGWSQFFNLTDQATCPVFALGGLSAQELAIAWAHGAQGIAGIRAWWPV